MIRFAQMKDIPRISKRLSKEACFIPDKYRKMLPVTIMMRHVLLSEKDSSINGILGFSLTDNTVLVDCIYAFSSSVDSWSEIVTSLLRGLIHKFVVTDNLTIALSLDCLGNPNFNMKLLNELGFMTSDTKFVSSIELKYKLKSFDHIVPAMSIKNDEYENLLQKAIQSSKAEDPDYIIESLLSSKRDSIVLTICGLPVGLAIIQNSSAGVWSGFAEIKYFYIDSLYVDNAYADELILAALSHAARRGASFLEITLGSDSPYLKYVNSFERGVINMEAPYYLLRSNVLEKLTTNSAAKDTAYFI